MNTPTPVLFANPYTQHAVQQLELEAPTIATAIRPQYAQCGEDLIVVAMLDAIGLRKGASVGETRYFEIGANHPVATSSTYLLYQRGASGVLAEANPKLIDNLRRVRSRDTVVHAAVVPHAVDSIDITISAATELSSVDARFPATFQGGAYAVEGKVTVPAMQLNALLEAHWHAPRLSFISIDVEGIDFELLRTIDFNQYGFDVLQIEPSDGMLPGNSFRMTAYLSNQGYMLAARTDVNLIFVRRASLGPEV